MASDHRIRRAVPFGSSVRVGHVLLRAKRPEFARGGQLELFGLVLLHVSRPVHFDTVWVCAGKRRGSF